MIRLTDADYIEFFSNDLGLRYDESQTLWVGRFSVEIPDDKHRVLCERKIYMFMGALLERYKDGGNQVSFQLRRDEYGTFFVLR